MKNINLNGISISNKDPFVLISGPCAMESRKNAFQIADALYCITKNLNIPFVFKASFDKANRTSLHAKRGVSLNESLEIFTDIKKKYDCPVLTDVHEACQCEQVSKIVDILQIPAFLCRQTDLLIAAAKTGKIINIKKGQFLAPWDMENVYKKVTESGNDNVMLCERGACFGYNRLVSDMRSLKIMADYGYPIIFDATHSVQEPGGLGGSSGGNREFVEPLSRAALSVGVAGLFIETHFDPENSYSDGPNMVPLHAMEEFLEKMKSFDQLSKTTSYTSMNLK